MSAIQPALYALEESAAPAGGRTAAAYLAAFERLADEAASDGLQGLQEACLLLMESLGGLPPGEPVGSRAALLDTWPERVQAYRQAPRTAAGDLLAFLRHPDLRLPLSDEEFDLVGELLAEGAGGGEEDSSPPPPEQTEAPEIGEDAGAAVRTVEKYLAAFERLADEAASDGLQGLQEACLVLMESLGGLPPGEPVGPRAALLDTWPERVQAYRQAPRTAAGDLLAFLRHPDLRLPLSDEEFDLVGELLAEGTGGGEATSSPPLPEATEVPAATSETSVENAAAPDDSTADAAPAVPLPRAVRELVDLLLMAAESIGSLLDFPAGDPVLAAEGLQPFGEGLENFVRAARTAGFEGLALAGEQVGANIQTLQAGTVPFTAGALALLHAWLAEVKAYLPRFGEPGARHKLVARLSDGNWPAPLSPEAGAAMLARMAATDAKVGSQPEEPARVQAATAADVSLALPDDVNRELLDILLQELPTYTQQFSEAVQRLPAGGDFQDLEIAQRVAHTLKGSANTVGIRGIAVLTHHLEDILLACARERKLPGSALAESLITAADCLESMSEALLGSGAPPDDAQAVLQEVLDWANRIDREGIPQTDEGAPPRPQVLPAGAAAPSAEPAPQAQTPTVRVPTDRIENLFRLSGESIILNGQAQERLRRIKNQLQAMETEFALLQQLGTELEALIDLKDLSGRAFRGGHPEFDALEMDQYNELYTVSRRMVEATVDAREVGLDLRKELGFMDEVLDYQQHLVIDTQEAVMQTRLVPIASIAPRLQRGLRQTCRLTGKQADLTLSGGNLLIDGDTLNALVDPLMHLLRNAVDHGLESAEERLALGKPRSGRIAIEFDREGNNILVHCRDDGRGLDLGAIRATAEQRGLVPPGQAVSPAELERFILRPNFSTRTQSTQTSGRGVGMDAVHVQVVALGGTLALHSSPGQGLTVELRVPLPLSRSHALLAYAGNYRVAIANKGLAQIFYSGDGELQNLGTEPVLLLGDHLYPVARLGDLLHIPEHRHEPRAHGAVLLVQAGDRMTAVLVDAVTDSRDVVIKNFGYYIPKIPGLIGATILGDGTVTPVLDIPELLRGTVRTPETAYPAAADGDATAAPALPTVLVVDDSLSQRRALEQMLGDAGYRVRSAHDGLEAAELLVQFKPDIVLTDLEMPRMNGIELTAHIRTQAATRHLPVLMITSRTTHKHRQMAEQAGIDGYFTKPVRDEELLTAMQNLLDGRRNPVREAHA
jgi:chemotaxis protein histidine kinase CheA/ActR/RegA family two-component response regulator